MKLTIPKLPPTDNHLYGMRGRIKFMYKEGKDWKLFATEEAKKQYKGEILTGSIFTNVKFYLKRDRDVHGSLKLLFDSLEGIIYENDKQITKETIEKFIDKENPRIEIEVLALN